MKSEGKTISKRKSGDYFKSLKKWEKSDHD
jgi:hypothetical protein